VKAPRRLAPLAAAIAFFAILAACGSDDNGGTIDVGDTGAGASTTSGGSSDASGRIELTIERSDTGERADLSCIGDSVGGSGWLGTSDAADAACALVRNDDKARRRLIEGQEKGIMCTQIYGGPEQATVTGTIDGDSVDTTIARADGCGVADWTLLEALLGPPGV